jgi:tRNA(fMet)-specific endonuclease VapC
MFVLDTDTLTLVYTAHRKVIARRASVSGSEIAITVVTRIEVLQGRFDFLLKAATVADQVRAQEWLDATADCSSVSSASFRVRRGPRNSRTR